MRCAVYAAALLLVSLGTVHAKDFSSLTTEQLRAIIGSTPEGEPTVVAQTIIHESFDREICPLVVVALRLGDTTINAVCNNGEKFRVFGPFAMRCSVLVQYGMAGC